MSSFLRYAAVALCVALALTACTKSTQSTTSADATQTTAPDAVASASAAPGATATNAGEATTATSAPAASATTGAMTATTAPPATTGTTTTGSTNGAPGTYIDMPVYPGATESKDQDMSVSANGGSLVMKIYATKDDAKKVADWYKSQLPTSWKGGVLTAGAKTVGTFSNEMSDGDQSVIVASQDDGSTRVQLTTKHGK